MSSGFRLALIALLIPLVASAGAVGQAGGQSGDATPWVEDTTLEIQLQPDGDARWSVSAAYNLSTANRTAAFRTLAEEFTAGETDQLGLSAFERAAAAAALTTDREMGVTDIERTASPESAVENGTGRLTLSFTWTNFARVERDRLTVSDVLETPDGTWLPGLDASQRLVLRPPAGYAVFSASPDVPPPRNGTLVWTGPETFGPDSFSVTFTGSVASTATPTDTPNGPDSSPPGESGGLFWALVVTLTLGTGAAVMYVVVQRRDDDQENGRGPAPSTDDGGDIGPAGAETAAATTGEADAEAQEELLSDEERVERLLERNGGRMKQATIVKETGWSNAKVSQLLSAMAEAGQVDKLRIGRENLISFPEEDVTDLDDRD
ncbi:MAG: putative membrane protein [Salinirussus sp.]|jgi:uncharacterized membrane protein